MAPIGRNDPCSCGSGKKSKFCCARLSTTPTAVVAAPGFSPRASEKTMQDLSRHLSGQSFKDAGDVETFLGAVMADGRDFSRPAATPAEQAQDLMYDAWDMDGRDRLTTTRRALDIDPDCADAYVVLAEGAKTEGERLALLTRGVDGGRRTLGEDVFNNDVGHFWGMLETRPFMRALFGQAQSLWDLGRKDEAIAAARELLRLNPNDNQGVRDVLMSWLLQQELNQDAKQLLEQYPDDIMATWAYARALLAFRQDGDTRQTRRLMRAATKTNPHVPAYLAGEIRLPRQLPDMIGFGDENEAIVCADLQIAAWAGTNGAVAALQNVSRSATSGSSPRSRSR